MHSLYVAPRARWALRATAARLFFGFIVLAAVPSRASAQSQPPAGFDKVRIDSVSHADIHTGGHVTVTLDPATIEGGLDPAELILYLDHVPLAGTKPVAGGVKRSVLRYRLDRTPENRDAWLTLFRRHGLETKRVQIGIGLVPFGEIQAKPNVDVRRNLSVVFGRTLWIGAVVAIVLALCMVVLGGRLLRERPRPPVPLLPGRPAAQAQLPDLPYSLGRVQMAFWFTLVAGAYVVISLATRDHNGIFNDTTLILMGIGVGTALGSAAVQAQKRENALRKLQVVHTQAAVAKAEAARRDGPERTEWGMRAELLQEESDDLVSRMGKSGSKGFWKDLIYDDTGPSFHRFQVVAWTIIFGVVFIRYVVWYVAMPTFDSTLLALMGISGGTYLGFKIPERQP